MEDRPIKEIKTSCPFPLLIYRTNIRYNEVRKASGIADILLEMIDKTADPKETISDVLLKFGIPAELHYIFGKEIAGLIGTDIINSEYSASYFIEPRYFRQIKMGEIKLSWKGKIMFRDKAIPTGQEKVKQKEIYFDPVNRKFDVVCPLPYTDLSASSLGEDFIEKLEPDISGMGDYINADPTKMGIKAEERIISFETEEPLKKTTKQDGNLTIVLHSAGVEFRFATSNERAFFNRYFSSEIMERVLAFKPRYRFTDGAKNPVGVPTVPFEALHASDFFIPDDTAKQAKRPCKIFLGRGRLAYEASDTAIRPEREVSAAVLDGLDRDAEFALFDPAGCTYYRALNVVFPCAQFGDTFTMQLLAETRASDEQFRSAVTELFNAYKKKPFGIECSRAVIYAAEALKREDLFEAYADEQLSGAPTADEKIGLLLKLDAAFAGSAAWRTCFMRLAENFYTESVKEVTLDNMIYKNTVLSPLVKEMGISAADYIVAFSQTVVQTEEAPLVFQALSAAGFKTEPILGVVNVVGLYMRAVLEGEAIVSDDAFAAKFSVLQTNFNRLNRMLGIESLSQYTLRDEYNADEFFNAYGTFLSVYRELQKYKQYAEKEFGELSGYQAIYDPIHEVLSIERTAASHPGNITKKYIDERISRGRYKDAICDLLVKLQFDLRKRLQADDTAQANELIDMAREEGWIDGKEANMLHKLRICRNRLQHPDKDEARFERADVERWRDIVFSIGGNK